MPRQSISFLKPNDEWLKAHIDNEEYSRMIDHVIEIMAIVGMQDLKNLL